MSKLGTLLCVVLAVGFVAFLGVATTTVLAQTGAGRLTIQLTNVVDEPIVDYDRVTVPIVPAEGGTFTVPIICYCGVAVVLGIEVCGTDSLRIESSRDLSNWAAFPSPGFQLTLSTNDAAIIPMTGTNRFFRGVWD